MTHAQLLSPRSQDISSRGQPEQPSVRGWELTGPRNVGQGPPHWGPRLPRAQHERRQVQNRRPCHFLQRLDP